MCSVFFVALLDVMLSDGRVWPMRREDDGLFGCIMSRKKIDK